MKIQTHKIELYKVWLILIECQDIDELNKFLERAADGYELDRGEIFAHSIFAPYVIKKKLWQAVYLVFNTKDEYSPITTGIIAHEAFHASCFILDKISADPDFNNPEPQAYLIEYVTNLVDEFLKSE